MYNNHLLFMNNQEQFRHLLRTTGDALQGVNGPAAKLLIDDFRDKSQALGVILEKSPKIGGAASILAGGNDWTATITPDYSDENRLRVHVCLHLGEEEI
jgi:hypothetical protein